MSTRYQCNCCSENLDAHEDVELGISLVFKDIVDRLEGGDFKVETE